jgi:hypothetical protein
MSDKPTQSEYDAMRRMVQDQINSCYRDRSDFTERGDPTDSIDVLIRRWTEIYQCVAACEHVDRLTRVEHVKDENAECAVCRDANAEVFTCTDGLLRCRRCGGGA